MRRVLVIAREAACALAFAWLNGEGVEAYGRLLSVVAHQQVCVKLVGRVDVG